MPGFKLMPSQKCDTNMVHFTLVMNSVYHDFTVKNLEYMNKYL